MSYSTLYLINTDYEFDCNEEFHNGWGSSPIVWDLLCERYRDKIIPVEDGGFVLFAKLWQGLIKQYKELELTWWEYNSLIWANTATVHKREDFEILAQSLREFQKGVSPDRVSHLLDVAKILEEHKDNPLILGMCYYATSVADNPWIDPETQELYKFTPEDELPYAEMRRP